MTDNGIRADMNARAAEANAFAEAVAQGIARIKVTRREDKALAAELTVIASMADQLVVTIGELRALMEEGKDIT